MIRVRLSRALAYVLIGDGRQMFCSHVHYRRHWLEPWIDRLIFWHYRHCERCARWEALQAIRDRMEALSVMECPPVTVNALDEARRAGM